jgi:hypothetical protein
MRSFLSLALPMLSAVILVFASGCARETGRGLLEEQELERIREDLARQACISRMDSLCFEIDGILYRAQLEDYEGPVDSLLPDSLPSCPLTGLTYIITEEGSHIRVSCPSGHGSQIIQR